MNMAYPIDNIKNIGDCDQLIKYFSKKREKSSVELFLLQKKINEAEEYEKKHLELLSEITTLLSEVKKDLDGLPEGPEKYKKMVQKTDLEFRKFETERQLKKAPDVFSILLREKKAATLQIRVSEADKVLTILQQRMTTLTLQ